MNSSFQIISWNINSIKKRRGQVVKLLEHENTDFLLLQETRCNDYIPIEGYYNYHHGSNGRNGVAIISKYPLLLIESKEDRYMCVEFQGVNIISVYVYNGGSIFSPVQEKIRFLNNLKESVSTMPKCIVGGDFNVLYNRYEYHNINPYSIEEIDALKNFEQEMCFYPSKKEYYTWWDYRNAGFQQNRGMGLDKFYFKGIEMYKTNILRQYREYGITEIPSDHAPISSVFWI